MPSIHFTVTAEDKNLQKVLRDIENGVNATSSKIEKSGMSIDDVVSKLTKGAAALGLAFSAKELVAKVTDVRGEFQQLEVAFNTMLGSGERASALMAQLTQTAAVTPFGLQEVAGSAKQLLAYGVAAEEVNDRLIMLGDIAAGLSIPLSDLAYLYGTTMTQGRMYTQDLNQFMGRGIPIADELAKQFGVTKDKVKDLVTSGKVGFEEMHKSLVAMTSAGGKFGGLMEAQSKTIKGQISNLEDAIDVMFNNIGKSQEGVINTALSVASKLVENYETVGKVLMSLVATYGAYKAAVIATVAIQKVETAIVQQAAVQKALAAMAGHTLTASQARGAAVGQLFAAAQAKVAASLRAVSAAAMANPYALITAAVVGLVAGVVTLSKKIDENTNAFNRVKEAGEKYAEFLKTWEQQAQEAISTIQSETATNTDKIKAYQKLQSVMPAITEQYTMEELAVLGVAKANEELAKQREEAEKKGRQIQINNLRTLADQKYKSISGRQLTGKKVEKEEIEEYHEIIRQIKELQAIDKKLEEVAAKPKVKDKKYWEDQKKDLQMKFEALTPAEEGTEPWKTLVKQIQEADAMIAKYNVSKSEKDDKEANELKAKKASYQLALEEYKQEIISATQEAQMEIHQAEINAMKDGNEKALAQIGLDYDKRIAENENRKQEFIKEVADLRAEQWEIENPKRAEKGEKFDKSTVTEADLTPQQRAILEYYDLLAQKERELAQVNTTKELLSQYQTYMQKRKETYEKYERDLAAMKNEDGSYKEGFSKENEDILNKNRQDSLDAIDVEFAMREEQFEVWANEIASKSLEQLENLLVKAELELEKAKEKIGKGEISKDELARYLAAVKVIKNAQKNLKVSPEKKAEKDWKELYEVLGQISSQFNEIGRQVGGLAGEIISLAGTVATGVISMIDGVKTLSAAAAAQMSALEKASVVLAIVSTAIQVVTKIADMFAADYTAYNKAKEAYQSYINVLDDVIGKQKELIETMTGDAAIKSSEEALRLINKQIAATKKLGKERLNSGASGGSHSIGRRIRDSIKDTDWGSILRITGGQFGNLLTDGRLESLFDMPVEKLKQLKAEVPTFWAILDDEVREYLETIISCTEEMEEVKETLKESLTQVSFDSLYDSFIDTLMDMEASSEDFANDLSEMLTKALISDIIGSKYKERLKKWYESWAASIEDGQTTEEIAELKREYQEIVSNAIEERNAIADMTGYGSLSTTEQKATYGGFETMSEDTGSELNGRFTALQMAGEEIKTQMISSVAALNSLVVSTDAGNSLLTDILTQHAITNAYLEDIVKYAKTASGFGAKLDKIVEQTKNL